MALTIQDIGIDMAFNITQNTKDIMNDLEVGNAFDDTQVNQLSAMAGEWSGLHQQQDNLFGTYSPIHGVLQDFESTAPLTLSDVDNLVDKNGAPITLSAAEKQSLIGKPRGFMTSFENHVRDQFSSLTDNIGLYSTHQSVRNAMGNTEGCGSLADHFGSIMTMGQQLGNMVQNAKNIISDFKAMKTQIQSEINDFDQNAVGVLTGKINNTVLSNLVVGSGLHDQLDKILVDSGIAPDSVAAQEIREEIGERLTPQLNDFYNKKAAVNSEVEKINKERGGLLGQIGKEVATMDKATTTLRRLGAANSLQSLFKTNECVQTLMGFVGQSGFIGKLGI